ncbi:hypothetical protein AWC19_13045 [Mycobacterium palustre]|uniref:Uncharacterized protein n=1 Tax=Mycobacterium palustre TaxID=153971 RepID=A0A1X1ZH82_9MYCO|nr:hypothetical protein AWC19_13045 [Mycobacterium palustre]
MCANAIEWRIASAGNPVNVVAPRCPEYTDAKMLPAMATPRVPPSSRVVSLTAEPTLALSAGSDPMMASVAGAEQQHLQGDLGVGRRGVRRGRPCQAGGDDGGGADPLGQPRPQDAGQRDRGGDRQQSHAALKCRVCRRRSGAPCTRFPTRAGSMLPVLQSVAWFGLDRLDPIGDGPTAPLNGFLAGFLSVSTRAAPPAWKRRSHRNRRPPFRVRRDPRSARRGAG